MAADVQASDMRREERLLFGGLWFGPDVPFDGYEQRGIGSEMGRAGLGEYLETTSTAEPA